jgi:hypothetical protein
MAVIRIDQFKGIAPAVSPTKLAEGAATEAEDCRVEATSLRPEKKSSNVESLPNNTKTFYKWRDLYWVTSSDDEYVVESPVVNDVHKRIYLAGGTYPRYSGLTQAIAGHNNTNALATEPRIPTNSYRLGVPAPTFKPVVSVSGTANQDASEITTAYVFTYVTAYGEEGPPSPASNFVTFEEGETRTITVATAPSGNYNFGSGALVRLYRTATGNTGTEFLFVDEAAIGTTSFTDTDLDSSLGEVMPSTNWYRPLDDDTTYAPDGPLKKIVMMPDGFLAGFAGRVVCFSEQYLPHAWNPNNQLVTESEIVTIQDSTFGLVVLTQTRPYVAVGSAPSVMGLSKLDVDQSCASAESVADLSGTVIYSSPDGLVGITGNQAQLITDGIFTREQWQAYDPTSIRGVVFENRYFAFYDDGTSTGKGVLIYDPANPDAPFMTGDFHIDGHHVSAKDDVFYMNSNGMLQTYGTGSNRVVNWQSKHYAFSNHTPFAWLRVVADGEPKVTVRAADFVGGISNPPFAHVILAETITNDEPIRLPVPPLGTRAYRVEISGNQFDSVDSVTLASERGDL